MKKIALAALCCLPLTAFAGTHEGKPMGDKGMGEKKMMDEKAMMDMMKPAPEMEKMKGMIGTWKCDGKSADMGKPTMHAIKANMKISSELGGHWMMVDYAEEKTKENAMPFAFKEAVGFDRASGKFHRMFMDNMGGTAMMSAMPSADGKVMEWTGEAKMGEHKMPMKDVMTMKSDKETLVDVTMQGPDGKWMPVANMTCKK